MKPEWCSEELWERALAVQDKAIERCEAEKLAYRFPTCNGKSVLDEEVARALLEAHQLGRREGMEEAAALLRDHATISNGEALDPAVPEILAFISAKAQEVSL